MTFLHQFQKILAINYKKAQCYNNAWLFLFKMSHHTSLSVKYSRRSLNFPPAQSTFEISLSKASSDQAGGVHISQPTSITSGVLLRCAVQAYCCLPFLCILHDTHFVTKALESLQKKKSIASYIGPLPHPLHSLACRLLGLF